MTGDSAHGSGFLDPWRLVEPSTNASPPAIGLKGGGEEGESLTPLEAKQQHDQLEEELEEVEAELQKYKKIGSTKQRASPRLATEGVGNNEPEDAEHCFLYSESSSFSITPPESASYW